MFLELADIGVSWLALSVYTGVLSGSTFCYVCICYTNAPSKATSSKFREANLFTSLPYQPTVMATNA